MDKTLLFMSLTTVVGFLLLGIGVIYSRVHWAVKVALILAGGIAAGLAYFAYVSSLGYPLKQAMTPEKFIFAGGHIREPLPSRADAGAIYLLIVEPGQTVPRTIEIPYSKANHKKVLEAKKEAGTGKTVYMTRNGESSKSGGSGKGSGKGMGDGENGRGSAKGASGTMRGGRGSSSDNPLAAQSEGDIDFVPPPSTYPDKDEPQSLMGE